MQSMTLCVKVRADYCMNKFTFKLPDRLRLTVERNGRVRSLTFHSKEDLELKLLVKNVKELLDSKDKDGVVNLKEHSILIVHTAKGVDISLLETKNVKSMDNRRVHHFTMNQKDFKKFIKVCKEVYTDEQK